MYIIWNFLEGFWSNNNGWVEDIDGADIFNEEEKNTLNLPIDGRWVRKIDNTHFVTIEQPKKGMN